MELWCAPHVFMAQVRDEIVVLDLQADRYHCLLDAAGDVRLGRHGALQVEPDIASDLMDAGFVGPAQPASRRRDPARALRELIPPPGGRPGAVLTAGVRLSAATLAFQRRSLPDLLIAGRRAPAIDPGAAERIAHDVLSAGRTALPWIPFEGECLQRAFQLRRLLRGAGVETDWVFGVRTWPFAAHCWLQLGDLVVGDRLERVRRYTPIMAA